MKKHLLVCLWLSACSVCLYSQTTDKTVENIRKYYSDISEKARLAETDDDHGETGELVMNELVINKRNHQWRAVGIYNLDYKFFYNGGDNEAHMYPDQLVKAVVTKKISSRNYTEEFLFSDAGVLMFYFQKWWSDDQLPAERRVYFSGINAVRIIEDAKTRDRLTAKDLATIIEINEQSRRIKEIFAKSIKL